MPVARPMIRDKKYRAEKILTKGIQWNMKADTINENIMVLLYPKMPDKNPEKNIEIP
jgi:hypothetical protein